MKRGVIAPFEISKNPKETGAENRWGPALPGLRYKTLFLHSILG